MLLVYGEDVGVCDDAGLYLAAFEFGDDSVAYSLEALLMCCSYGLCGLLRNLQGVDGCAILPYAVVEVWTGRCTCRAYITDELTLCYLSAHLDALSETLEVEVSCHKVARVLDF